MELLIPKTEYIKYRMNKGNLKRNKKLDRFITWRTSIGRNLFDISEIDKRLRIAARFLSNREVAVISTELDKEYAKIFCEFLNFTHIDHYTASIFSNPQNKKFYEPDILFITNVNQHRNVVEEANLNQIPVVAFCNTNSNVSGIDLIVPLNTISKKAIGIALWLIANEVRKLRKEKEIILENFIKVDE